MKGAIAYVPLASDKVLVERMYGETAGMGQVPACYRHRYGGMPRQWVPWTRRRSVAVKDNFEKYDYALILHHPTDPWSGGMGRERAINLLAIDAGKKILYERARFIKTFAGWMLYAPDDFKTPDNALLYAIANEGDTETTRHIPGLRDDMTLPEALGHVLVATYGGVLVEPEWL